MTYIGGCLPGYEPDPLKMGIAWSDTLTPGSFTRLPDPILTNTDSDVRPFETTTLYKSNVIFDSDESLGCHITIISAGWLADGSCHRPYTRQQEESCYNNSKR